MITMFMVNSHYDDDDDDGNDYNVYGDDDDDGGMVEPLNGDRNFGGAWWLLVVCLWPRMTSITCFIIPMLCHKTAPNKPALFAARNYSYTCR